VFVQLTRKTFIIIIINISNHEYYNVPQIKSFNLKKQLLNFEKKQGSDLILGDTKVSDLQQAVS